MQTNSSCYKAIKSIANNRKTQSAPLNFCLTKAALEMLNYIFDLPEKFTKYAITEDISMFYIRTHHLGFVRLYNKNKKYLNKLQDKSNSGDNKPNQKLLMNHLNSTDLCKHHLKCLYSIAKHRTQDTRNKMFQF